MSKILITEINRMRSIMGLDPKSMINEAPIPIKGLIELFGDLGAKFAAKTADDIGSELGIFAKSGKSTVKKAFDNLAVAVRAADNAGIEAAVRTILGQMDSAAIAKFSKSILDDATNGSKDFITKRAKALSAGGADSAAIKNQLKTDLDTLFSSVPDQLRSGLKSQADNIVDDVIAALPQAAKKIDIDDIMAELASNPLWKTFTTKFPDQIEQVKALIKKYIDEGAKTEDEIITKALESAKNRTTPGWWDNFTKKYDEWKTLYPKEYKNFRIVRNFFIIAGALGLVGGAVNVFVSTGCYALFGGDTKICTTINEWLEENNAESVDPNNNNTGSCGATLDSFKTYLENLGIDASDATWDTGSCTGTVSGESYSFKDGQFI